MRSRGIEYLVGTPKGRLTHVEKPLPEQPWTQARESVRVKKLQQCLGLPLSTTPEKALYVLLKW